MVHEGMINVQKSVTQYVMAVNVVQYSENSDLLRDNYCEELQVSESTLITINENITCCNS